MNRRFFLMSTATALAVSVSTPAQALFPVSQTIDWTGTTAQNPHARLIAAWIEDHVASGILPVREELMWSQIKLTDPTFKVIEKPVFNWMTGYTEETGLAVDIYERGVRVGQTSVGTNIGYEAYFNRERPADRSEDYFMRGVYLDYDDRVVIEAKLPKGHIDIDQRWLNILTSSTRSA